MLKVIQVIMERIKVSNEHQETEEIKEKAKIAVLVIIQKFADDGIFGKEECTLFLDHYVQGIKHDMGFKIKRFLLPALISISKHLDYAVFQEQVYSVFHVFTSDEVWGVRKAAIEYNSQLIEHLRPTELEKLKECFTFFKKCLCDSNRWVKNQALQQFGPIAHKIYLKAEQAGPDSQKRAIKALVREMCETYYDMKLIFGSIEDKDLEDSFINRLEEYSFAQNQSDDIDKIRYYWAYNMPCAILVTESDPKFWLNNLKQIYEMLHKDVLINVRKAMAAGYKEVIKLMKF